MPTLPSNFDGAAFQAAYNLADDDFWVKRGILYCPSHPELTDADLLQFVVDLAKIARIEARRNTAEADAKAIPDFADKDATWFAAWFDTRLSDTVIDNIASFADLKVVLKDIVIVLIGLTKFMIAVRNKEWPHLPED